MVFAVGVIGAGVIGNRVGTKLHNHKDLFVKRVLDIDEIKGKLLADKFSATLTNNLDDLILDDEIKIIYVGTPPKYHAEYTIKSLEAGKHVICEKPITLDHTHVGKMIEARDKNNRYTAINLTFRYNPGFIKIKEMLDNEELGEINNLEIKLRFPQWPRSWQNVEWLGYREQGGPLREIGSHYLFGLTELFGKIVEIKSETVYPDDKLCEISSKAMITLENGMNCKLSLITGGDEPEENTLSIYGEKQSVHHRSWGLLFLEKNGVETQINLSNVDSEIELVDHFARVLLGEDSLAANFVDFETAGHVQQFLEQLH